MDNVKPFELQEVQIQYVRPVLSYIDKVDSSQRAEHVLRNFIDETRIDHKEFFWVMFLSRSNRVLGLSEIGKGNVSSCTVNISEIFQLSLKLNASSIIISHNHPSGQLKPSESDTALTQKIVSFAKLIGIKLFDHIIITSDGYFSFADDGLIK